MGYVDDAANYHAKSVSRDWGCFQQWEKDPGLVPAFQTGAVGGLEIRQKLYRDAGWIIQMSCLEKALSGFPAFFQVSLSMKLAT